MISLGPPLVYVLCLATSLTCAALLARSYRRRPARLLLWLSLGFAALALNNLLLVIDTLVFRGVDLWVARQLSTAAGIGLLLYGFIWESSDGR